MKHLVLQTPKPSSSSIRSKFKETPQSKRSEQGSNDPKILKGLSADALDLISASAKQQQKIVSKSLNLDFEYVSEDLSAFDSDLSLFSPDLESGVGDRDQASSFSPESTVSAEIVQEGAISKKAVPVSSPEAAVMIDLMKQSIAEFKSSAKKLLDPMSEEFGLGKKKVDRWSNEIFLMKLQVGFTFFLISIVILLNFMVAFEFRASVEEESSFSGLYPT